MRSGESNVLNADECLVEITATGKVQRAVRDLTSSLRAYRSWIFLAQNDIRLRYRRSVIGPFWMVLTTGASIACIGAVFSLVFSQELSSFLPYLAAGIICWQFILLTISEACGVFYDRQDIFKNVPHPFMIVVFRMLTRNLIVFAHNLLIFVATAVYFGLNSLPYVPLFLVGVALFVVNGAWIAVVTGVACSRFRDLTQLVATLLSLMFLVTPVFWEKKLLGENQLVALINPFNHFLEVMRAPLLGKAPELVSVGFVAVAAVLGWAFTIWMFAQVRDRLVFWL